MAPQQIKKSAENSGEKNLKLKTIKSNERFNNLKIDYRHSLLSMSEENLSSLEKSETNLLRDFVDLEKRIVCIPADSFHTDYQLRAVAQYHGLEYIDAKDETNIYSRHKVCPGTTLAEYLKSLKAEKEEKEKEKTSDKDSDEPLKASRSTEQFQSLKIDHQFSLLNISGERLMYLNEYEKCILGHFVEQNERIYCISSGIFYCDYRLRAIMKYYGLEYIDDEGDLYIYAQEKIIPGTSLVDYLQSLKEKEKSESNEQ